MARGRRGTAALPSEITFENRSSFAESSAASAIEAGWKPVLALLIRLKVSRAR